MKTKLENAIKDAQLKIDSCIDKFTFAFPAPMSTAYRYEAVEQFGWSEGFWTGILWILYELTGNEKYKEVAEIQCDIFKIREEKNIRLNHHDIGFLYSLSCVAAYKITGEEKYKQTALKAADRLCLRYRETGKFLQAWGNMDTNEPCRLIIDCLINIPLLFWAESESGNKRYREIAQNHLATALKTVIRPDFTTYHTFMFDSQTEEALGGKTAQGYSDDSCWARGQAWGILGIALAYSYTKKDDLIPIFNGLTEVFISKLPSDYIPYWDLIFTEGNEPRDTSAASIAVCGILQMSEFVQNKKFEETADKILESLMDNYTTRKMSYSNGLVTDAMNNYNRNHDSECNIWGDYFYLEAIIRKSRKWNKYW